MHFEVTSMAQQSYWQELRGNQVRNRVAAAIQEGGLALQTLRKRLLLAHL